MERQEFPVQRNSTFMVTPRSRTRFWSGWPYPGQIPELLSANETLPRRCLADQQSSICSMRHNSIARSFVPQQANRLAPTVDSSRLTLLPNQLGFLHDPNPVLLLGPILRNLYSVPNNAEKNGCYLANCRRRYVYENVL